VAARSRPARGSIDLDDRLRALLRGAEKGTAERLAERLLPARLADSSRPRHGGFYWLLIPEWLAEEYELSTTGEGRALLADLSWIQYCVYALFRVQDDLVDGDVADPLLAVEANRLLVEASSRAARHFPGDSPFWRIFSASVAATSSAITLLDPLQRDPDRPPNRELELYADLSASLKIAAAGVAIAAGRPDDWEARISPALDRLGVAAQIVDDLRDVRDDLRQGRINYVAWRLGQPVFGSTREATEAVIASNLATTDRLAELLAEASGLVGEALDRIGPDLCPRAYDYLREYRDGVKGLDERISRSRHDLLRAGPKAA
jgi:hypothetical protein